MASALLVVGLLAPVLGALGAMVAVGPVGGQRTQRAGCLVAAGAWALLAARGRAVSISGFHVTPLLGAAACGAALLAAGDRQPPSRRTLLFGSLALTGVVVALTGGRSAETALAAVSGLLVASGCGLVASRVRTAEARLVAAAALAGVVLTGLAFVLVRDATGAWTLPRPGGGTISTAAAYAFLAAAAALVVAGSVRPGRPLSVLVAGGLGLGLMAAPLRLVSTPGGGAGAAKSLVAAVVLLAGAAALAAVAGRAGPALAFLALATVAGPLALTGAARLLAAAAVLVVAIDRRPAWILGVPGGVALAIGADQAADDVALGLALAAGVIAAVLTWRLDREEDDGGWWPDWAAAPAVVAGAWLFVAPDTWSWTGPAGLGAYDLGAARAAATALIAVALVVLRDEMRRPARRPRAAVTLADILVGQAPDERPEAPEFPGEGGGFLHRRRARRAAAREEERGLP